MEQSKPTDTAAPAHGDHETPKQSALYRAVMTPVNLIVFLVSLYLVDCHYQEKRSRDDPKSYKSRLPAWLRPLIYRPQPYEWVDRGPAPPNKNEERWYYHSKQKKLMKMEAADAFEMRNTVLIGLVLAGGCVCVAVWRITVFAWFWLTY